MILIQLTNFSATPVIEVIAAIIFYISLSIFLFFLARAVIISTQLCHRKFRRRRYEESATDLPVILTIPAPEPDDSDGSTDNESTLSPGPQGETTLPPTHLESPEVVVISPGGSRSMVVSALATSRRSGIPDEIEPVADTHTSRWLVSSCSFPSSPPPPSK